MRNRFPLQPLFVFLGALFSCPVLFAGTGSTPGFSLDVSPMALTVAPGGPAQTLTVAVFPSNGFTGTLTVHVGSLPAGVRATPASFSLAADSLGQISISAAFGAAAGTTAIAITGSSGGTKQTVSFSLTVAAPLTTASLNTSFFDFGNNLVGNKLIHTAVVVTNTGTNPLTMSPVVTGDPSYSIVTSESCGAQLAPAKTCDIVLRYVPTVASAPKTQDATLDLQFADVPVGTPHTVAITGTSAVLSPGVVSATHNPQVALYTMTFPFPGRMRIRFGPTAKYGTYTWWQSTDTPGSQVSVFVAGMMASSSYHMQAEVDFSNGIETLDVDHTFTTTSPPAKTVLDVEAHTTAGMTPQPGIEMVNDIPNLNVMDLSGNSLWVYANPGNETYNIIQGVKLLPNGDFLMDIGALPGQTGNIDGYLEVREVNLAGDTVREITINDLNQELQTATCAECSVTLGTFHHDVTPLPNGHWLVLGNTTKALSPTSTPPLTNEPPTTVTGDVVVDLDENLQPVWAWNEFNHLDPNRHPMLFPDWTHTNAILYSPDDGNILVSMRNQNWVVKVDYANGTGKGGVIWHLGYQGDFALKGGTDPTDWQYGQHGPGYFTPNTIGIYSLGLMDNGNDRVFPTGVKCGSAGAPPCYYTTVPVFQIDEKAMTATLTFHQKLPTSLYSYFGGNTDLLANGDVEYDLCGPVAGAYVYEVTQERTPRTVWSLHTPGVPFYRAFRLPSFYPGVQW